MEGVKGVYTISNNLAIYVYDINYGIDDEVVWAYSNDVDNKQTSVIGYDYEDEDGNPFDEARAYFLAGEMKVYMDEVMRTDLTEGVDKLVETEAKLDQNVKEWLLQEYPEEEEFLTDMDATLTFKDVYERMLNGEEIYEITNIGDSTDREYIFNGLSEATGKDYDYFYQLWVHGPFSREFIKQELKDNGGKITDEIIERAIKGYLDNSDGIFTDDSKYDIVATLTGVTDLDFIDKELVKRVEDILHTKFNKEESLTEAEEKELYVYSDANSQDELEVEGNVYNYKQEAPELTFKVRKEGDMYFVDFIGSKEDIENYLKRLGWYNDEELASEEFPLIKKYN